jgi:hypothetical protein
MSATIYVANDGNWGGAEPDEFVILYGVNNAGLNQLGEATDDERWELAQEWAAEQEDDA